MPGKPRAAPARAAPLAPGWRMKAAYSVGALQSWSRRANRSPAWRRCGTPSVPQRRVFGSQGLIFSYTQHRREPPRSKFVV